MIEESIHVQGAREHNLRNIDIQLPKDKLIVFTGVSGSGKSSLAIDTVYAEGQRRYIESLSAYARQFLGQLGKPDVDEIIGLSPSIAISQGSTGHNPRSTVATVTEIYDYLRVLYARVGQFHCPECGSEVGSQTAGDIVKVLLNYPQRTRLIILAPIFRGSRGAHEKEIEDIRSAGFARLRVDGEIHELRPGFALSRNQRHDIDLVVDRIIIKDGIEPRIAQAVNTALTRGNGSMLVQVVPVEGENSPFMSEEDDLLFSEDYTCLHCQISFVKPEPRHFSFNNPD
ncbi:MAG: excinuclease ABC subunit UvrA, partial [Candidatus Poribacteria bacterium]|nr:excinuclease ABC subunit UvrA [Candidatus Poribacteria bacterium]